MADIARPALASVLAALTQYDPDRWPDDSFSRVVAAFAGAGWTEKTIDASGWGAGPLSAHWTTTNPAEAAELLATRDVLPAGWCDVERRGWRWTSFVAAARSDCEVTSPTPRTIPDLVAVASLEWPAIQRAEELARAVTPPAPAAATPTGDPGWTRFLATIQRATGEITEGWTEGDALIAWSAALQFAPDRKRLADMCLPWLTAASKHTGPIVDGLRTRLNQEYKARRATLPEVAPESNVTQTGAAA